MTRWTVCALIVVGVLCLPPGAGIAVAEESENGVKGLPDDPVFLQWLVPGDPGDETIREYWERATRGELSPEGMVDLGTMLYRRGYPKDAVRLYRKALDQDKNMYEAWYRIGVVEHRDRNYEDARYAYKKCLKILSGHGWCNFYLGLLEEHTGHPSKALEYYANAYAAAPELADPRVNPDILYSKIQIGAAIQQRDRRRFTESVPMPYLEPSEVRSVQKQYLPAPTATPTPLPTATVTETTQSSGASVGGASVAPSVAPSAALRLLVGRPRVEALPHPGSGRVFPARPPVPHLACRRTPRTESDSPAVPVAAEVVAAEVVVVPTAAGGGACHRRQRSDRGGRPCRSGSWPLSEVLARRSSREAR